ncbi:hypothetical protein [Candidatus Odyssella acanthamoebae]|uniref:Uncharacterized protein n=1 Tax=Candidatus Odyssella acanthamoebae TaxID=91604 RepID=A0A077AV88_9PROT|nr:hypothetical protein [Candidatus Paracaedibacter acanthamoebae]AIK96321.1 hypothetical protein ID47_05600 [Candidatus Paracaedibacter acanthamoebae]
MIKKYLSALIFMGGLCEAQASVTDKKGAILPEVLNIASFFNYTPSDSNSYDIAHLNTFAHKTFLRPHGSERYEDRAIQHYKKLCAMLSLGQKQKLIESFRKLGGIDPLYPKKKDPDYIVIQGATVPAMRERLMFLVKLIEDKKIKLSVNTKIIFLVGERALFQSETPDVLLNPSPYEKDPNWQRPDHLPTDEREAAKFIWFQLKLPAALRDLQPHFTDAQKNPGNSRAQTQDCIQMWLKTDHVKGNLLMVSSNPYINYQESVVKLAIKKAGLENNIQIDSVGPGMTIENTDIDIVLGIALDTLARTIFTEKQQREASVSS